MLLTHNLSNAFQTSRNVMLITDVTVTPGVSRRTPATDADVTRDTRATESTA